MDIKPTLPDSMSLFVYVLVSTPADFYLEQAFLSMYSLKHYNPDAYIVMLTDQQTAASLTDQRKLMTRYCDKILPVAIDSQYDRLQRSRILKSTVRKHVAGKYMFIDTDTIVVKPLSFANLPGPIAACRNLHAGIKGNLDVDILDYGYRLGWPVDDEEHYFNSGVLYVEDTAEAHRFYERWYENLIDGFSEHIYVDQSSFAKTNYEQGHIVKLMDDVWNCQIRVGIRYLKEAKIVHYFNAVPSKFQSKQYFMLTESSTFQKIKATADIPPEVKRVVDDPFCGLPEVAFIVVGDELNFMRTHVYGTFRSRFNTRLFHIIDTLLRYYYKLKCMVRGDNKQKNNSR